MPSTFPRDSVCTQERRGDRERCHQHSIAHSLALAQVKHTHLDDLLKANGERHLERKLYTTTHRVSRSQCLRQRHEPQRRVASRATLASTRETRRGRDETSEPSAQLLPGGHHSSCAAQGKRSTTKQHDRDRKQAAGEGGGGGRRAVIAWQQQRVRQTTRERRAEGGYHARPRRREKEEEPRARERATKSWPSVGLEVQRVRAPL